MACTIELKQLLKSFCINSPWIYAVLWKLRRGSPVILTWEDGYCVYPMQRESVESISSDVYSNTEIILPHFETNVRDGWFGGYPIDLMVANMSDLSYKWGEGIVGKVACTGKHFWISYDDIFTNKANSKLLPEYPEEWLLQFVSGIKTILLVPVFPHGVLQLGSLEMVAEDLSSPSYLKDRFIAYKNYHSQLPSSPLSGLLEKLEESSSASVSPPNSEDSNTVDSIEPNKLLDLDQIVPLSCIQDAFLVPEINMLEILESETKNKINVHPVGLSDVCLPMSQSITSNQPALEESELFGFSCPEEELQAYPECNAYSVGECGEILDGITNPDPDIYFLEPRFEDFSVNDASICNFPKDCELHEALGPAVERQSNHHLWESSFNSVEPSSSAKGEDAEYLLQAVVGHVNDSSVDIANRSNCVMTSAGQPPVSSQPQIIKAEPTPLNRLTSSFVREATYNFSSKVSANSESTLTDNKNMGKDCYRIQSSKGQKQSRGITKRRAGPGDNTRPRPRPRDRQMIQDRLRELRELVPNGAKYSIDALLDQTVKHMLYLRSVTNQAEKLRQWVHHEVTGRKNIRSSETRNGSQNGTSWAFEIGDELKVCPIVVEDLAYPGHLLIEMLCNEHALFLEIAQVIRSFNLTILKGVMESSSDNTWAHFIVEASKGFHRLDIFWPLMQLLQRQRNYISSKI